MLHNFSFVVPEKLAGSAHPGNNSMLQKNLEEMRDEHGITAIVSLTEESLDPLIVSSVGMRYLHVPVADFSIPRHEDATKIVQFVFRELQQHGRAVIHCAAGMGRTGTLLACCLYAQDHAIDEAVRIVRRLRPGSIETIDQENFVKDWSEEIGESTTLKNIQETDD